MTRAQGAQQLEYVGPDPAVVGIVPLPEGWPALDHEEPDAAVAAEKVASGNYRRAKKARDTNPGGDAEQQEA